MLENNLRYAFLTTYMWIFFIKRIDDYQFELSPLVAHNTTNPSLRQCFVGFVALAATDASYYPDPGFNHFRVSDTGVSSYIECNTDYIMQLFVSGVPGFQASDHSSLSRDTDSRFPSHADEHMAVTQRKPVIGDINLGSQSIFIGARSVIAAAVTCVHVITQTPKKMVAEVQWIDGCALAKCWVPGYYDRFFFLRVIFEERCILITPSQLLQ